MIPEITNEMGRNWSQPSTSKILVDDTHALMDEATFKELAEYSSSIPSGVYDGKMWKRHDGIYDKKATTHTWMLMWYGPSVDPEKCSINTRLILKL
jgi:hypothetical protein